MTRRDTDRLLDELFEGLAPEARPVDTAFVTRVEARIAELERYSRWRTRLVRRLGTEALAAAAIGAALAFISRASEAAAALSAEPTLIWTGLFIMLLCWLGTAGARPRLLG